MVPPQNLTQVALEVVQRGPINSPKVILGVLPCPFDRVGMHLNYFICDNILIVSLELVFVDYSKVIVAVVILS